MLILPLIFRTEFVENRIHRSSKGRTCHGFQEIRRSDDLLNHSIRLFFIIQILLESIHVARFHDSDNWHWMSNFVQKSFERAENQVDSNRTGQTQCNQKIERLYIITCKERATNKHAEKCEAESCIQLFVIHLLFAVQFKRQMFRFIHNSLAIFVRVNFELIYLLFGENSIWYGSSYQPYVRTSKFEENIIHLISFNNFRIRLSKFTDLSRNWENIFRCSKN